MQDIVYKMALGIRHSASVCLKSSDGLKATYYNQENKVDKIVEGVCIHYKVHDVHPTLQSDDLKQDKKKNSVFK